MEKAAKRAAEARCPQLLRRPGTRAAQQYIMLNVGNGHNGRAAMRALKRQAALGKVAQEGFTLCMVEGITKFDSTVARSRIQDSLDVPGHGTCPSPCCCLQRVYLFFEERLDRVPQRSVAGATDQQGGRRMGHGDEASP